MPGVRVGRLASLLGAVVLGLTFTMLRIEDVHSASIAASVCIDCSNGQGDCVPEPMLVCDGLQGRKCVYNGG